MSKWSGFFSNIFIVSLLVVSYSGSSAACFCNFVILASLFRCLLMCLN
jgi:hypothetical protein